MHLVVQVDSSWSAKVSMTAQKFATSCEGSEATWKFKMFTITESQKLAFALLCHSSVYAIIQDAVSNTVST